MSGASGFSALASPSSTPSDTGKPSALEARVSIIDADPRNLRNLLVAVAGHQSRPA